MEATLVFVWTLVVSLSWVGSAPMRTTQDNSVNYSTEVEEGHGNGTDPFHNFTKFIGRLLEQSKAKIEDEPTSHKQVMNGAWGTHVDDHVIRHKPMTKDEKEVNQAVTDILQVLGAVFIIIFVVIVFRAIGQWLAECFCKKRGSLTSPRPPRRGSDESFRRRTSSFSSITSADSRVSQQERTPRSRWLSPNRASHAVLYGTPPPTYEELTGVHIALSPRSSLSQPRPSSSEAIPLTSRPGIGQSGPRISQPKF